MSIRLFATRFGIVATALLLVLVVAAPAQADEADLDSGEAAKQRIVAQWLGVDADEIASLRDQGLGWGAIYQLQRFADARGVSPSEVLAGVPMVDGERDLSFGELRKGLTDDERVRFAAASPRNFGQLVSNVRRAARDARKLAKAERVRDRAEDGSITDRAERKAARDEARAERKAARDQAKAERKAARDQARAERKAARDEAKAARGGGDDRADSDDDKSDD